MRSPASRLTHRLSTVALGFGTAGALITPFTAAAETGQPNEFRPPAAESDPRAILLLTDASRAARVTSYSGTQYVSAWGDGAAGSVVVQVSHIAAQGTVIRVQPSADGPGGTVFEPERPGLPVPLDPLAVASVERGPLDLLRRNYQLTLGSSHNGSDEVIARRPDDSVAARFWIARASKLATRREVYDVDGTLVRATAYVDLTIGRQPQPTTAAASTGPIEEPVDRAAISELRQQGWVLPAQLPEGMVLVDARRQGTGKQLILHLSYTDGLSTVSVFAQRGRLVTKKLDSWRRARMGGRVYVHDDGLTRHVTWSAHGKAYTVVTDAPPRVLTRLVERLPHGQGHRGFWGRLEHGLERLGSWLDPFH